MSAVDMNKSLKPLHFRLLWEKDQELFSLVLSSLPGGKWDTEFPSEHENWPGFNYVSWQALADICTKETSQPQSVFVVACSIYELWTWRVLLGGCHKSRPWLCNFPVHVGLHGTTLCLKSRERSKAKQPQAFNNPHTEAFRTPGCWKLGIVWSLVFFFLCVGGCSPLPPGLGVCEQAHS